MDHHDHDLRDALRERVRRALAEDGQLRSAALCVYVDGAVIMLKGTVDTRWQRIAAIQAAHRVRDARDLVVDIVVNPPRPGRRSDTAIARDIRRSLEVATLAEASIHSTICDGWVTLEGVVTSDTQREEVVSAAQKVAGIRGVQGKLVIDDSVGCATPRGSVRHQQPPEFRA